MCLDKNKSFGTKLGPLLSMGINIRCAAADPFPLPLHCGKKGNNRYFPNFLVSMFKILQDIQNFPECSEFSRISMTSLAFRF